MSLTIYNGIEHKEFHIQNFDDLRTLRQRSAVHTINMIQAIQASGDELDYIKTRFANIPTAHGYCTWRGEVAKFIYENL